MVRKVLLSALAALVAVAAPLAAYGQTTNPAEPRRSVGFAAGVSAGYYSGFGMEFSGTFSDFASGMPLAARVALGYAIIEPGSATDARRIFINNATNGTPEKSGRLLDLRIDALFRMTSRTSVPVFFVAGPRYSSYKGNFKFIGGNEDFDVTSGQWGLGLGLEGQFAMGRATYLVVGAGADYFFESALKGHDTVYRPAGDDSNPRRNYTFEDADEAINQPRWVPRFMVGFVYAF